MATYTKRALSGSTHGRGIKVAATAIGSGDTIHTATADSTEGLGDLITLLCYNSDTVTRNLVLGWGGTTSPDDLFETAIPSKSGLVVVTADMLLRNTLIVKAACATTAVLILFGHVHRIA